jgi:hypothetical protein
MEETHFSEEIISNYFHLNYLVRLEDIYVDSNDHTHDVYHKAFTYAIDENI